MADGTQIRCPTCRTLLIYEQSPMRPFCSERCRLIDLGDWASERFRIPARQEPLVGTQDTDEHESLPAAKLNPELH